MDFKLVGPRSSSSCRIMRTTSISSCHWQCLDAWTPRAGPPAGLSCHRQCTGTAVHPAVPQAGPDTPSPSLAYASLSASGWELEGEGGLVLVGAGRTASGTGNLTRKSLQVGEPGVVGVGGTCQPESLWDSGLMPVGTQAASLSLPVSLSA